MCISLSFSGIRWRLLTFFLRFYPPFLQKMCGILQKTRLPNSGKSCIAFMLINTTIPTYFNYSMSWTKNLLFFANFPTSFLPDFVRWRGRKTGMCLNRFCGLEWHRPQLFVLRHPTTFFKGRINLKRVLGLASFAFGSRLLLW